MLQVEEYLSVHLSLLNIDCNDTRRRCAIDKLRVVIDGNLTTTGKRSIAHTYTTQHLKVSHDHNTRSGCGTVYHACLVERQMIRLRHIKSICSLKSITMCLSGGLLIDHVIITDCVFRNINYTS